VKTFCIIRETLEDGERSLQRHCSEVESDLKSGHPVFSRLETWMTDKMRETKIRFYQEHMWDAHNNAIQVQRSV
jgi:hypothetical protein